MKNILDMLKTNHTGKNIQAHLLKIIEQMFKYLHHTLPYVQQRYVY